MNLNIFAAAAAFDRHSQRIKYNFFKKNIHDVHEMIYAVTRNWLAASLHQTILCIQKWYAVFSSLLLFHCVPTRRCERDCTLCCVSSGTTTLTFRFVIVLKKTKSRSQNNYMRTVDHRCLPILNGTNKLLQCHNKRHVLQTHTISYTSIVNEAYIGMAYVVSTQYTHACVGFFFLHSMCLKENIWRLHACVKSEQWTGCTKESSM